MTEAQGSLAPSFPVEDSANVWLLKRRHEDISSMFRTCWDLYIKFYTVFLTFSVAAMGWVVARDKGGALPCNVSHVLLLAQGRTGSHAIGERGCGLGADSDRTC
jgi:hypothetical protein